ncbi:MAG: nucleotidyltransferase domain-containing protein [Myxococcaceae bacterium]
MLVRLFGSYARGTPLADSDVDVFVLLDRTEPADRKAVIDLADDLSVEANLEIAPLIFDESRYALWKRQERRLIRDVEQEGISA